MNITYDPEVNAAYVQLVDVINDGESHQQTDIITTSRGAEVIFDFDVDGFLLGVEVLNADRVLREDVLSTALRLELPES